MNRVREKKNVNICGSYVAQPLFFGKNFTDIVLHISGDWSHMTKFSSTITNLNLLL